MATNENEEFVQQHILQKKTLGQNTCSEIVVKAYLHFSHYIAINVNFPFFYHYKAMPQL